MGLSGLFRIRLPPDDWRYRSCVPTSSLEGLLSFHISPGKGTNAGCLSVVRDCVIHTVTPSRQRLYAYGLAINLNLQVGIVDKDQRISTVGHDSYLNPFQPFPRAVYRGRCTLQTSSAFRGQVVRCSGSTLCTNKVNNFPRGK